MGQREIKKKLKRYAATCEKLVPEEKEYRIREIMRTDAAVPILRTRGTLWNFVLEQLGYLGRYCLIWQAVWIVLFCYMMRHGAAQIFGRNSGNEALMAVSILPPLLILLTVEEVTKVYQRSMLEIEYATKYSLRSAVMLRMLVLCIVHSVILLLCIVCLHSGTEMGLGRLLVYGFTPMTITASVVFKIMQYWQGELLRMASAGLYAVAIGLIIAGNAGYFDWYQPAYFKVWCIVCAVGIVCGGRQLMYLNRKLASYEAIVR